MKTSEDNISKSSDISDENLESSVKNINRLGKSKNSNLSRLVPPSAGVSDGVSDLDSDLDSDSDSDSDGESGSKCSVNNTSVNKNSKNEFSSRESPITIKGKVKEKPTGQEMSTSLKSVFTFEDLTPDDEIFTFQYPEIYKKQDLLNRSIDFTKRKQTLTTETEKFEFELINSGKKFITLAVPRKSSCGGLVKLPLKGHIIIQKVVDAPIKHPVIENMENNTDVIFPQDIKTSHPLLGVDWKAHIQIAKEAIKNKNLKNRRVEKEDGSEINEELKEIKQETSKVESPAPKKRKRKLKRQLET